MTTASIERRSFLTLLGASAAAWPVAVGAQQPTRMRRIGLFMNTPSDDPITQANSAAILQGLQELGWTVGRNVQLEWRWYTTNAARTRKDAEELIAFAPDVIITTSGPTLTALQQVSRAIPIVFTGILDPVGGGYIASLARPGGNVTGFAGADYSTATKWLELLREIEPRLKRALVFRTATTGGGSQFGAIQGVAPALGVEVRPVDPSDRGEIERSVTSLVREPNGGMIVTGSSPAAINRDLIIGLAARHRLPAVYSNRFYVVSGGLVSYGAVAGDVMRRATGYIDRILKGEKPSDLPVQAPTRYETVLNLKTARALGLDLPATVLLRADEVIE